MSGIPEGLNIRVGDRYRCEAIVTFEGVHASYSFELDMSTLELIEPAKTPGQRAYEAYQGNVANQSKPWDRLRDIDRQVWEHIAEAART